MKEKEETKEEVKDEYIVAEIPDTMKEAIGNPKTREALTLMQAVAEILNNQRKLMKLLD